MSATAQAGLPSIDAHAHVFRRDLPMAPTAITLPDHDFTPACLQKRCR